MLNIAIFIFALLRMRMTSSSPPPITVEQSSEPIRRVQAFHEIICDYNPYQAKISSLEAKISNLSDTLSLSREKERTLKYEIEQNKQHGEVGKVAVSAVEKPQATVTNKPKIPQKVGDDFHSDQEFQVPNIVHYIWYNTQPAPFQFHHMLSVLSVHKFIKPDIIYFHTDTPPTGKYWDRIQKLPELKINKRKPPHEAFNEKIKDPLYYTSHSNVDRVLVLMEYGGIYLDFDFIAVNSFDDLRRHVCTIGLESDVKVRRYYKY